MKKEPVFSASLTLLRKAGRYTENNGEAKCQSPLSVSDVPGSRLIHIWKSSEESDSGEYVEIIATFLNPCGVFQGIRAERAYYDQGELGDHPDVYNDFDSKKSNTMRAGEVIGYLRFAAHVQMVGRLDIARQSVIEAA